MILGRLTDASNPEGCASIAAMKPALIISATVSLIALVVRAMSRGLWAVVRNHVLFS
jgi:hypothetical protein